MKIITLLKMEIACVTALIVWLFLISSSQSTQIGDNLSPYVTTAIDSKSDYDGKCLSCINNNQFATKLFNSQENFYMDYEDEATKRTTTEPLMKTSINVMPEKLYVKRNLSTSIHPDDLDTKSELYSVSSHDNTANNAQFQKSDLFGSMIENREEKSTNTDFIKVDQRPKQSSSSMDDKWFGPQLGRRNKRLYNNEETMNTGMWFGPRLGQRDRTGNSEALNNDGMWFGPRLGRRDRKSGNDEVAISDGMWFGPRLGRRNRRSGNEAASSDGMWFGPRLGRRNRRSTNEAATSDAMWFGPTLGRRNRRSTNEVANSDGMWFGPRLGRKDRRSTNGEVVNSDGMWFGPRLGKRDRRSTNEAVNSGGMWFGPRLGKRDRKSGNDDETASAAMWFGPKLGRIDRRSTNEVVNSDGMWFGPRLGRRDRRSTNEVANSDSMWFGPRLGKRDRKLGNDEEAASGAMWFGPRLGRRDRRSTNEVANSDGMWFGPRLGRSSARTKINIQATNEGMWFEPRLGQSNMRSLYNEEPSEELRFDSRPGHVGKKSCNNEICSAEANKTGSKEKKLFSNTASLFWALMSDKNNSQFSYSFTPRLGRDSFDDTFYSPILANRTIQEKSILLIPQQDQTAKKVLQRNVNIPNSALFSNLLSGQNNKQPDYIFTPRLGRELYENKLFSFAENTRSTPKKSKPIRKYGFFTPRLGRYVDAY